MSFLELEKEKTKIHAGNVRYNHNHDKYGKFAEGDGGSLTQGYSTYKFSSDVDKGQPSISYGSNVKTEAQKTAVAHYTSGKGIDNYENINKYLNGTASFDEEDTKTLDETIKQIDSSISGKTDSNMMVYRGIAIGAGDIDVGDVISNAGFTSTSAVKDVADDFANYYGGITISIKIPAGTKALFIGYNTGGDFDEAEVLFGRGASIKIVGKEDGAIVGELSYE